MAGQRLTLPIHLVGKWRGEEVVCFSGLQGLACIPVKHKVDWAWTKNHDSPHTTIKKKNIKNITWWNPSHLPSQHPPTEQSVTWRFSCSMPRAFHSMAVFLLFLFVCVCVSVCVFVCMSLWATEPQFQRKTMNQLQSKVMIHIHTHTIKDSR